jgi:zinc/manganese transport system substrate-binding protein
VVTYHKSWIYFTEWAGLSEVAFIEPKPGLQPNPTHVANVLGVIKARHVPLLLQEEWYSSATSELLAHNSDAALVRVPGMTGEDMRYADTMGVLVDGVVKALAAQKK